MKVNTRFMHSATFELHVFDCIPQRFLTRAVIRSRSVGRCECSASTKCYHRARSKPAKKKKVFRDESKGTRCGQNLYAKASSKESTVGAAACFKNHRVTNYEVVLSNACVGGKTGGTSNEKKGCEHHAELLRMVFCHTTLMPHVACTANRADGSRFAETRTHRPAGHGLT